MLFPTLKFAGFFFIVFVIAAFLKRYKRVYALYLTIISFVFYAAWDIRFAGILGFAIIVNYLLLRNINSKRRFIFILSIIFNLILLGFFKYYNFFSESLIALSSNLGLNFMLPNLEILLPIGISFYVFKIISHHFDVYRGKLSSSNVSLINYAAFVSFFPQITAGPIGRAEEFYTDLGNMPRSRYSATRVGLLILSGLLKKVILASFIFNFFPNVFALPENFSSFDLIIGVLAYGAYLFADFSGYSDLSEALSNLLGFRSPQNFDGPYGATDLQTFWRKWHMTLSSWLKDYLYIPLGGGRVHPIRKYLNLFLTMLIGGLWHGAAWQFVIWGMLHGIGLGFTHLLLDINKNFVKIKSKVIIFLIKLIGWIGTVIFVNFTWIFFGSSNIEGASKIITNIFKSSVGENTLVNNKLFFAIICIYLINIFSRYISNRVLSFLIDLPIVFKVIIFVILFYFIFRLIPEEVAPFVYYKF